MKVVNALLIALSFLILYAFFAGENEEPVNVEMAHYEPQPNLSDDKLAEIPPKSFIEQLLNSCRSYIGTKHRIGGLARTGIDCSGLLFINFKSLGITIPRSSGDQSTKFTPVDLKDVATGDLVFFGSSVDKINHAGIISKVNGNKLTFIHTSTSSGVIEENLGSKYWATKIQRIGRPDYIAFTKDAL